MRSSEKPPQHITAQTNSGDAAVPSTSAEQANPTAARDISGPPRQIDPPTKAIQVASDTIPNRSASQIAPREDTELPASRESPSSDIGVRATPPTSVIWPDPPPMAAPINAREANAAAAIDAPVDLDYRPCGPEWRANQQVRNPYYSISGSCDWARGDWFRGSPYYEALLRSSRANTRSYRSRHDILRRPRCIVRQSMCG